MIKIFSSDKIIHLIDDENDFEPAKESILQEIKSKEDIVSGYQNMMSQDRYFKIYFYNKKKSILTDDFFSMFQMINAAGGLVKNQEEKWLFIFRNNKWDLPKGKIEKGETVEDAAIREVQEECGIGTLSIVKKLPSTYHTYSLGKKDILKCTYWFEMECKEGDKLIPQTEEGITDVKWFDKKDLKKVCKNTYESIKEVIKSIHI